MTTQSTDLDGTQIYGCFVRHDDSGTVLDEPLVTSVEDGVEHGLVEEEISHPLADDDVDGLDSVGQRDLLELSLDERDHVVELVILDDLNGLVVDRRAPAERNDEHGEHTIRAKREQSPRAMMSTRTHRADAVYL